MSGDEIVVVTAPPVVVVQEPTLVTVTVPGVQGPVGPRGPAGDESGLGYVYTTSIPAMLHQVNHGFLYKPSGIICYDADGLRIPFFEVAYPAVGITEITFGVPVTPTIYLS